jgi:hypothetical protein
MTLYLTEADKRRIDADRCDLTLHTSSEHEYLRLHPNLEGKYMISRQKRSRANPWRVMFRTEANKEPAFGSETVTMTKVAGGVFAFTKPRMDTPVISRINRSRRVAKPLAPEETSIQEAFDIINREWQRLGDDFQPVLDVENRTITAVAITAYGKRR